MQVIVVRGSKELSGKNQHQLTNQNLPVLIGPLKKITTKEAMVKIICFYSTNLDQAIFHLTASQTNIVI